MNRPGIRHRMESDAFDRKPAMRVWLSEVITVGFQPMAGKGDYGKNTDVSIRMLVT
jgi:hypothetical protein